MTQVFVGWGLKCPAPFLYSLYFEGIYGPLLVLVKPLTVISEIEGLKNFNLGVGVKAAEQITVCLGLCKWSLETSRRNIIPFRI